MIYYHQHSLAYLPTGVFGVFIIIFGQNSRFITHSLIVTHFADLPLIFEKLPFNLTIFATHFHSYRLRGSESWLPRIFGTQITHFGWSCDSN